MIHDGDFVILLRHRKLGLVLPNLAPNGDEPSRDVALKAVEEQFGPVLKLVSPKFESMFLAALAKGSSVDLGSGQFVWPIHVESIRD